MIFLFAVGEEMPQTVKKLQKMHEPRQPGKGSGEDEEQEGSGSVRVQT